MFILLWPCRTRYPFLLLLHLSTLRLSHFCHRHLNHPNMSLNGLKAKFSLPHRRNRDKPDANESNQPLLASRSHVSYAGTGADLHSVSSNIDKTGIDRGKQPAAGEVSPSQSANTGPHYTLPSTLIHCPGLYRQAASSLMLFAYLATTTILFQWL